MENREILLNHYISSPYKKEIYDQTYTKIETKSDSCIDHLNIFLKKENDKLVDAYFNGEACSIATSSCSILLKNCINKNMEEIKEYIENFERMINDEPYDEEKLQEAIVFKDIVKQGNRVSCAYLPYKGLKKWMNE